MRKHIFFDFGRTIVEHPEDGAGLKIVHNAGAKNEQDAEIIRNQIFSVSKFLNDLDEGLVSFDEYLDKIAGAVPERLRECALKAAQYDIYVLPLIDGVEELLFQLKSEGFKLYITSNLNLRHAAQMREHKIAKYFDGMIFSAEIKCRKPHKEYFESALKKFNVTPDDCLFIDDLEENVIGAENCGICSFIFKGNIDGAKQFIYKNSN